MSVVNRVVVVQKLEPGQHYPRVNQNLVDKRVHLQLKRVKNVIPRDVVIQ